LQRFMGALGAATRETMMRSIRDIHPEWGYLAPAPSFLRTVRTALIAAAVGATTSAAVVLSLVGHPAAEASHTAVAGRTVIRQVGGSMTTASSTTASSTTASSETKPAAAPPHDHTGAQGSAAAPAIDNGQGSHVAQETNSTSFALQSSPGATTGAIGQSPQRLADKTMRDAGATPDLAAPDEKATEVAISPAAVVSAQVDQANDIKVPRKAKPHRRLANRPQHEQYPTRFGYSFERSPFDRSW
jgi:hypothetical protein